MVSRVSTLPKEPPVEQAQIDAWLTELAHRRPRTDVDLLREAVAMAQQTHLGEHAPDGFDRFLSLLYTVDTLDSLKLDIDPLIAAVLSEMPGHALYDVAAIKKRFGSTVAAMVEQVSRIRELSASGAANVDDRGVENLRRMLLGIANDVRAILVVLAKRLQLMRRLKRLSEDVQRRVARETQMVHAPLANRLGVWQLKWELEDLAFATLFDSLGPAFFEAYHDHYPITPGFFEVRKDLYNLYPLLVHVRLFGAHYVPGIEARLKHVGL